jgi:hypothetical protein
VKFNNLELVSYEFFSAVKVSSQQNVHSYMIFATKLRSPPSIYLQWVEDTEAFDFEYDNQSNKFFLRKASKVENSKLLEHRAVTHNVFCIDNQLLIFGGNQNTTQTVEYLDLQAAETAKQPFKTVPNVTYQC